MEQERTRDCRRLTGFNLSEPIIFHAAKSIVCCRFCSTSLWAKRNIAGRKIHLSFLKKITVQNKLFCWWRRTEIGIISIISVPFNNPFVLKNNYPNYSNFFPFPPCPFLEYHFLQIYVPFNNPVLSFNLRKVSDHVSRCQRPWALLFHVNAC